MRFRQKLAEPVPLLDKYLIIDTQGGSEDIVAIVTALQLAPVHHRKVIGITCATGRRNLQKSIQDALYAQKIANTEVPIYKGSNKSLMLKTQFPQCIDLDSNFNELDKKKENLSSLYKKLVQDKPAALFIEESIQKYKEDLCIVNLGPITNMALAFHLSLAKNSFNNISSIRINGGSYTGVGNIIGKQSVQANMYFDPEAAHVVISNYKNVYINPIERTLQTDLRKQIEEIAKNKSEKTQFLECLLKKKYCTCGSLLNVLSVFNKSISPQVLNVYSQVIQSGHQVQGLMVNNWLRLDVEEGQQTPNTKIFTGIDRQILIKVLKEAFK